MTKRIILIVLIFNVSFIYLFSQENKFDSLEMILDEYPDKDTVKVNHLINIADLICETDNKATLRYCDEAIKLSKELNYDKGIILGYRIKSIYYVSNNNFELANENCRLGIEYSLNTGSTDELSTFFGIIASSHYLNGNMDSALVYFNKSLEVVFENELQEAKILTNIGNIYLYEGNYPHALDNYLRALRVQEELNNEYSVAVNKFNIAMIYGEMGNVELAYEYSIEALEYFKRMNYSSELAYTSMFIAHFHIDAGEQDEAMSLYKDALKELENIGNKRTYAECYVAMCQLLHSNGQYKDAIDSLLKAEVKFKDLDSRIIETQIYMELANNYNGLKQVINSIKYAEKAKEMAITFDYLEVQKDMSKLLSQLYEQQGDYKQAFQYHVMYKTLSDSLLNEKDIEKITNLKNQYEFEKEKHAMELEQQKKDALRTSEIKREKTLRFSLTIGIILILGIAVLIYRSFLEKKKINKILADNLEEIKRLNDAKDNMFAIIGHDLRGPIGNIQAFLDLIVTEYETFDRDDIVQCLKSMHQQSTATFNILTNLLAWANSQRNRITFKPDNHELKKIIDSNIDFLSNPAKNKHIRIENNVDEKVSAYFDENLLSTIIRNLLSNAIKFTPEGGTIKIDHKFKDDKLKIWVKDTGKGIEPEIRNRLFDIDTLLTTEGTNSEKGSGLGLKICKEFIDFHNGHIGVESEVGKGSDFWIEIPQ